MHSEQRSSPGQHALPVLCHLLVRFPPPESFVCMDEAALMGRGYPVTLVKYQGSTWSGLTFQLLRGPLFHLHLTTATKLDSPGRQ